MTNLVELRDEEVLEYVQSKMQPSEDSDFECRKQEAIIPRTDRKSFNWLARVLRTSSNRQRCGHDYDCCGCAYDWGYDIESIPGDLSNIRVRQFISYNY